MYIKRVACLFLEFCQFIQELEMAFTARPVRLPADLGFKVLKGSEPYEVQSTSVTKRKRKPKRKSKRSSPAKKSKKYHDMILHTKKYYDMPLNYRIGGFGTSKKWHEVFILVSLEVN